MNTQFVDIFGTPINIGDKVAFNPPNYKGLDRGQVVGFTDKSVRICWPNGGLLREDYCTRFPEDVVVEPVYVNSKCKFAAVPTIEKVD